VQLIGVLRLHKADDDAANWLKNHSGNGTRHMKRIVQNFQLDLFVFLAFE